MGHDGWLHRTYLFVSGSRPPRMEAALELGADAVVLDLEDSVAPEDKAAARGAVDALISRHGGLAPCDLHVRINRRPDGFDVDDVAMAVQPGVQALRLPKVESADEVRALDAIVTDAEVAAGLPSGTIGLYPTVESAHGAMVLQAVLESTNRSRRAAFGASDFLADISASGDPDLATVGVRSHMVLVSRAAGAGMPIDSGHPFMDDIEGMVAGARRAKALGFFGKSVYQARQVAPVNEVFTPDPAAANWARQLVDGLADGTPHPGGGTVVDGRLVAAATIRRAKAVLWLLDRIARRG